jgi:CRP-like cAMP-binding protein
MTRGAAQDHLGILERGAVELINSDGSERLEAPACFAEAVLVGELPLFQRVVAIEDSTVLRLHRVVFQNHPEMSMELAKLLARRLRRLHETPRSG